MKGEDTSRKISESAPSDWSFTFWALFLSEDLEHNAQYELRPLVSLYEGLIVFTDWEQKGT